MVQRDKIVQAEEYFELAYKSHIDGEIKTAIEHYKLSIETFPTAKAHTFLGWAYSLLGNYEEAIVECKIAIELEPEFGNPYNDIGSYLINLGRPDEAVEWLEKAIEAPDYEPRHYPYYNLGRIYEKKGDWFAAIRYYNKSLTINPDYEQAQDSVIRITTLLN